MCRRGLGVSAGCEPGRLGVNRVLEDLRPLVEARMQGLLGLGSVRPRTVGGGRGVFFWWGGVVQGGSKVRCVVSRFSPLLTW